MCEEIQMASQPYVRIVCISFFAQSTYQIPIYETEYNFIICCYYYRPARSCVYHSCTNTLPRQYRKNAAPILRIVCTRSEVAEELTSILSAYYITVTRVYRIPCSEEVRSLTKHKSIKYCVNEMFIL